MKIPDDLFKPISFDFVPSFSTGSFEELTSMENLFFSWDQFTRGKRKRKDLQYFDRYREDFLYELHKDLVSFQYQHGPYKHFYVHDPKKRHISKAIVRDRLVHHLVYSFLTGIYDKSFLFHSLSCRVGKGTHVGIRLLQKAMRKISQNGTKHCFALKMDIRRFFDSMDHMILKNLLIKKIKDERIFRLIEVIIDSFNIEKIENRTLGVPLGNVTSQIFANIYIHELDFYVKHSLHQKYYFRYCDDFIILSQNLDELHALIPPIQKFLKEKLFLDLHPKKTILSKLSNGVDFLGYVHFLNHCVLRTSTKKRMLRRLKIAHSKYLEGEITLFAFDQSLQSYLGILGSANQYNLSQALKNAYWTR